MLRSTCKAITTGHNAYDTIRPKSLTWTRKLSIQLNLAHVARKKYKKEEIKTNKRQCPFNSAQVKIREGSLEKMSDIDIVKETSFKSGVKGRGSDRW